MRQEIKMTEGPIIRPLISYTIPLILTGILQLLYNAADLVVVGQFAGPTALAAVGATGALTNLLVNLLMGLSVGAGVLTAQALGAMDDLAAHRTVHTSILVATVGGVLVGVFGVLFCEPLLKLMDTPDNVLPYAALYMKIIFAGLPTSALYNFGSAILRSDGETKRPLYFLIFSGLLNVALNLLLVIVFHWDVAGVAVGTIASQTVSAILILRELCGRRSGCRLFWSKLKIYKKQLIGIIRIGVPAGLQGIMFSISNVLIQSSINSFGELAMAGNVAGGNLDGFVWQIQNAFNLTNTAFVGQNTGAKKMDRVKKINWISTGLVFAASVFFGVLLYVLGPWLLQIYSTDPEVIRFGMKRLLYVCLTYFLCGCMETVGGGLRGMGCSMFPAMVCVFGVCGVRILWIYTYFATHHTMDVLLFSYPLSWLISIVIMILGFNYYHKKMTKRFSHEAETV